MFDEPDASHLPADDPVEEERAVAASGDDIDWDEYYRDPRFWRDQTPPVVPVRPVRRRAANGSILVAIALGFREVFDPERPEQVIMVEAPGDPDRPDKAFHLELDPDDPKATRATVRLWAKPGAADSGAATRVLGSGDAGPVRH